MQYGVCTWTFGDQPLEKTAKTLAEIGFHGVELLGDLSLYSARDVANILTYNGLQVFSLTPVNVDIVHPTESVRRNALDYFYALIDFAAELGQPLVSCHGLVTRIAPIATMQEEDALLIDAVQKIAERAGRSNLRVVFEVLNRYETHQIHTHAQALDLVEQVGLENVGVLLDAYHMNIEEADPAQAIVHTGDKLWLYHAADSNRQGIGYGHTDFAAQLQALEAIGYDHAIILECCAPGPNPFTPDKGGDWRTVLVSHLEDSLTTLKNL